jgi:hypothetical protein
VSQTFPPRPSAQLLTYWQVAWPLLTALLLGMPGAGFATEPSPASRLKDGPEDSPEFLRPQDACPQQLRPLVSRLLQDLPVYAGLVASRSLGRPTSPENAFGSVLLVSEPDFTPIDINAQIPEALPDLTSSVQQVFFTTLERQYWQGQSMSLQNYHWLFLTQDEAGHWYLALIYSSVGHYPATESRAPSPPQESSDGIIGQAVTLWLRDCRAGAVFPPETDPPALPESALPEESDGPAESPAESDPAPDSEAPDWPDSIELKVRPLAVNSDGRLDDANVSAQRQRMVKIKFN